MKEYSHPLPPTRSPLSAWKHYWITRDADLDIQEQLLPNENKEFLIGLEVAYSVSEEDDPYYFSMEFGKTQLEEEQSEPQTGETALSPEYIDGLCERVIAYINENISKKASVLGFKMQVKTNNVAYYIIQRCLVIGSTYQGLPVVCGRSSCPKMSRRWCTKTTTAWQCTVHNKAC